MSSKRRALFCWIDRILAGGGVAGQNFLCNRDGVGMLQSIKDQLAFFGQFRKRFETTGAIAPSSRFLARSMTRFLANRDRSRPARILEIGPGTGPVTDQIVRLLESDDQFDLVELNATFVNLLEQRFRTDLNWQQAAEQSSIHQLPLQEFHATQPYDFVISGLPLNNFPAEMVETLTDAYFRLLAPEGTLSYFEYMYVRPIRKRLTRGDENLRISRIDEIMQGHCDTYRIARDRIWGNIPPAWVQHLRIPASNAAESQ